ncbi:unnamed protein product [Calypogeia fissa]
MASSSLHCLSSATLYSSFSASCSAGAPPVSSDSPRANCQLIKDKLAINLRPTSKLASRLPFREVLSTSKRRPCLVWSGFSTIQGRQANHFNAALEQNEFLLQENDSLSRDADSPETNAVEGSGICGCRMCGRRGLVAALGGLLASTGNTQAASASFETSDYNAIKEAVHPARPGWYEELYAQAMAKTMASYEAEVADYKRQLFGKLDENVEHILELGIGTGPNLKYYRNLPHLQQVVGLDPNLQMAKYCAASATAAGLSDSQFEFFNAVGEGMPVPDESMDAVVCTLTLCSVSDVPRTLEEVKRVLRPGGAFLFVEHVVAPEGSGLRFWQGVLDPLQQWVADGCHLTRDTLQDIDGAQFGSVQSERFNVASVQLISPHIRGIAYK